MENAREFLERVTIEPGLSGDETQAASVIADAFRPIVREVTTDALGSVCARMGDHGPKILVAAHQDEIGLIVTDIEDDGCLRVARVGGVDARILPASEVYVRTGAETLFGVIGAKPPHLLTAEEQKKIVKYDDLFVDVGLSAETARARVHVGDRVTLTGAFRMLLDNRATSKTMDDRAGVAAMLVAAQTLSRMRFDGQAFFVATSQEEIGSFGAKVASYIAAPDVAIVVDVTHADMPGADKRDTYPLDKLTVTVGPNLHPALNALMEAVAKKHHIEYVIEPCGGVTATDAEMTQVAREGVPTVLIGLPLKYMHTTVELIDMDVIDECGRLIALFMDELAREWEGITWF